MTFKTRPTREQVARKVVYRPPSVLEMPDPTTDDVEYRWVRTSIINNDDVKNLSSRRREGWVPVRQDEHPDWDGPSVEEGKYAGAIGIGDLVLMKNSRENTDARREYYSGRTELQQEAVDKDYMKEDNPTMPKFREKSTRVTTGSRKKSFDDD
jgi:hypothetical protein